ncbi:uncharacterized protein EDB91DRAFT_1256497 [Suillus paluster]|uniref:uncharacterized protein n=1 Tax=Suillus paluster TaxID=48578 RepID=UPI001B881CC5|nr:uncharacterized protein EDB91DRAFT_1256497 [Suillus paluster]KAG1721472.1 hypothetical protein EDB91DRAFT_1256497 [Suillus paluster]
MSSNRPYQSKVRFEMPMETDESTFTSEADTLVNVSYPHELILPTSAMHCPNSRSGFNLGFSMAPPPPAPRFYFGINLPAAPSAAPPTLGIPSAATTQQPFNLGFTLPQPTPPPAPKPFNMGFNLLVQSNATLAPKPFNMGFNLLVQSNATPPPTTPPPTMPPPTMPPPTTKPFNLGFNLPMAVPHATPPATSSDLLPAQADTSRHFGCQRPTPIGDWQPELIWVMQLALLVASPPAIADAAPGLSTGSNVEHPTLKSLVGNAERSAMDIVKHLGGEEFDCLAQMMVGSALGADDDVQDPKPDEVLESNRMMLMAFCESRDRLTRIFKDLISLHHLAQVHQRVLPAVESLLHEVDQAEAPSGKEIESGEEM